MPTVESTDQSWNSLDCPLTTLPTSFLRPMHPDPTPLQPILDRLPDPIVHALGLHARSHECSVEVVLEQAIVHFFDHNGTSFEDCQLAFAESDQTALAELQLQARSTTASGLAAPCDADAEATLSALPAKVRAVLQECVVLLDLTPLQIIELAIAQWLAIQPVSFLDPKIDSPGKVRAQEAILHGYVQSTKRQWKRRSPALG